MKTCPPGQREGVDRLLVGEHVKLEPVGRPAGGGASHQALADDVDLVLDTLIAVEATVLCGHLRSGAQAQGDLLVRRQAHRLVLARDRVELALAHVRDHRDARDDQSQDQTTAARSTTPGPPALTRRTPAVHHSPLLVRAVDPARPPAARAAATRARNSTGGVATERREPRSRNASPAARAFAERSSLGRPFGPASGDEVTCLGRLRLDRTPMRESAPPGLLRQRLDFRQL